MTTMTATEISFGLGCSHSCDEFAAPLYLQMSQGRYGACSVLPVPASLEDWRDNHRTARKRAARARRLGYQARHVIRHEHADDVHAINTSMPERQGRPMSTGYQKRPSETPDRHGPCWRHAVHPYGVFDADETLRAYLWMYRAGDLALVSQILGHSDDLASDIMYLLFEFALNAEIEGGGVIVYNRHDSGTDGLRYFKERLGFREHQVEWLP